MAPADSPFILRAATALEEATSLDPVVDRLQPVADRLIAEPALRDALHGRKAGHALHPALTDLPLGSWTSAMLLDIFGGRRSREAARLLTGLGVLTVPPTALTGWAEWASSDRRAKRVGVVHAAAVGSAAALQTLSWVARGRGRWGLGVGLSLLATVGMNVGAFLGGHLAIGLKVGSSEVASPDHPSET